MLLKMVSTNYEGAKLLRHRDRSRYKYTLKRKIYLIIYSNPMKDEESDNMEDTIRERNRQTIKSQI